MDEEPAKHERQEEAAGTGAAKGHSCGQKEYGDQAGESRRVKEVAAVTTGAKMPHKPEAHGGHEDRKGAPVVVVEKAREKQRLPCFDEAEKRPVRIREFLKGSEYGQDEGVGRCEYQQSAKRHPPPDNQKKIEAGEIDRVEEPERLERVVRDGRSRHKGGNLAGQIHDFVAEMNRTKSGGEQRHQDEEIEKQEWPEPAEKPMARRPPGDQRPKRKQYP